MKVSFTKFSLQRDKFLSVLREVADEFLPAELVLKEVCNRGNTKGHNTVLDPCTYEGVIYKHRGSGGMVEVKRSSLRRIIIRDIYQNIKSSDAMIIEQMVVESYKKQFVPVITNFIGTMYSDSHKHCRSCMTGYDEVTEIVEPFFDDCAYDYVKGVYSKNNKGEIISRALLWYVDGEKFLDRVYSDNQYEKRQLIKYAENNGWWVRKHNSLPDEGENMYFERDGETRDITITIDHPSSFPYLDSVRYIVRETAREVTLSTNPNNAIGLCCRTDGNFEATEICSKCECMVESSEITQTADGYVCRECLSTYYELCDGCMEYCTDVKQVIGDYGYIPMCASCREYEDVVACDECNDLMTQNSAEEVEGKYLCPDCVESECRKCDECSEIFLEINLRDVFEKLVCEECAEELKERKKEEEEEKEGALVLL